MPGLQIFNSIKYIYINIYIYKYIYIYIYIYISFRRCKNLKDHLVRFKVPKEKDAVRGMFKCGSKKM
jgi:hypothetical protein